MIIAWGVHDTIEDGMDDPAHLQIMTNVHG